MSQRPRSVADAFALGLLCVMAWGCGDDAPDDGGGGADAAAADVGASDADAIGSFDAAMVEAEGMRACVETLQSVNSCPCGESFELGDLCCTGDVVMMCDGGSHSRFWRAISLEFEDSCNRRSPVPPPCIWLDR